MADFPTLSSAPLISAWEEKAAFDPTLRSPFEAGYIQTRPKFTRIPYHWHVAYGDLSDTDKGTLKTFENTVKVGSDSFNWTNPTNSTVYSVRFLAPILFRLAADGEVWSAEFDLEQV